MTEAPSHDFELPPEGPYGLAFSPTRGRREERYADSLLQLLERRGLLDLGRLHTCLDVGSGLGFKTRGIAPRFDRTVGIDVNEVAVGIAQRVNHDTTIEFRLVDASVADLGERFDLVTAFGFPFLNSREVNAFSLTARRLANDFVAPGGALLVVGQTDFSGVSDEGWFCHTRDQLRTMNAVLGSTLFFPQRDLQNYIALGPRHAAHELIRRARRRRSDYCFVLDVD
jgi:SAM-dependent methyltransferase